MKKKFCVQICADNEWAAFRRIQFENYVEFQKSPFGEYIVRNLNGSICTFYYSGATKTFSAAACQYAISNWKPEIIFVLGTAGGVNETLKLKDIVIANKTEQYDCISRMGNNPERFYEDFRTYIDNSWIRFENLPFKMAEGTIATADQDIDYQVREELNHFHVIAADWESGAIAPICKLNNVRCCIIRGISDIPIKTSKLNNEKQKIQFEKNTFPIMEKLVKVVLPELINYL
jgi:adenosylhomocysteine nucleosidase